MRLDVDARVGVREDVREDDEHDCRNSRTDNRDQRREEGQNQQGQSAQEDESAAAVRGLPGRRVFTIAIGWVVSIGPVLDGLGMARGDGQWTDEDHHEVEDRGG